MLNIKKVKAYINAQLEEHRPYYDEDIFDELEIDVYGGSFGRCFVSISGKYYNVNDRYCGKYNDVGAVVSDFVCNSYDRIAHKFYYEHKQEQKAHPMSGTLTIYQDGKQVNAFTFDTLEKAQKELVKIFIAKEKRGVKTRLHFKPYSDDLEVIQYFPKERNGTTSDYKYIYNFKGVNY